MRLPSSIENSAYHRVTHPSSPSQSHHVHADGGLVDRRGPGQISESLLLVSSARSRHIRWLPFGCLRALFLSVMLSRSNASELRLVLIRRLASFCKRSTRSGPAVGDQIRESRPRILPTAETLPRAAFGAASSYPDASAAATLPRRHADLETLLCLASRRTGLHSSDNASHRSQE